MVVQHLSCVGGRDQVPPGDFGKWVAKARWAYLSVALVAAVAISVTGWYGGEMVYGHGLGVKPMMNTFTGENIPGTAIFDAQGKMIINTEPADGDD